MRRRKGPSLALLSRSCCILGTVPTETDSQRIPLDDRRPLLVGRAGELHTLERAYEMVRQKRSSYSVTVAGGRGVGKTRLVRDFLLRMRHTGHVPRVLRGVAIENGSTYEAFAHLLRARFELTPGTDAEAARTRVRESIAVALGDRRVGEMAYFLGQLLDLDFEDSPLIEALEGDPQKLGWMRRAVIKRFLEVDAGKGEEPLVLVFDDLHWATDDSLDLLAFLCENLRGAILVVGIGRSELLARRDGWRRPGAKHHTLIELRPLSDADATAVIQDLLAPCGEAVEVEQLVDEAVGLAAGNPSVLEGVVRAYHETGVLEVASGAEGHHPARPRWNIHIDKLAHAAVPLTVEDAVQTRIAALSVAERQLLESAAAMGGIFWLGGVVAIYRQGASPPDIWEEGEGTDVVTVRQRLSEMVERDYILRLPDSTFVGDEEYVFKHNLEREALERLTPSATARLYHRTIAEWLAFRESVDASEENLEMLARHQEKAQAGWLAATSYLRAGDVARSSYANSKAVELYAKGLALLDQYDQAGENLRMTALHHVGDVMQSLGRNDKAHEAFVEMLTRAWRLDLRSKGGAAHARIGRLYRETGHLEDASRHLTAALALFGHANDDRGIASTLDDIGKLQWLRGEYPLALEYILRSLAMRRRIGDRRSIALSLNNLGLVHQDSGNYKGALEAFEQALRIRRDIDDLVGVGITLNNLGTVAQDMRDDARALTLFEEAYGIVKETRDRNRIALILTNLGETHNRLGDSARAVAMLKQAEDLADELGDRLGLAEATRGLGKAYLAQREYAKARECTERAVRLFAETDSKVQLGVALRSLGEVASAGASASEHQQNEATKHLKTSISIFEEIGNEVELARSSRSYAEILRRTPTYGTDPAVAAEANLFASRAEAIFAKMRASAGGLSGEVLVGR